MINPPAGNTASGAVRIVLAALVGFLLADMILLSARAPSLLAPAHLTGWLALLASGVILYAVVGLYLTVFFLLLWLLTRLLRLRFSRPALAGLAVVLGPLLLVIQDRLQDRILGMYINMMSPVFYLPTGITLVLLVVVLWLLDRACRRLSAPPSAVRKALAWPWLVVTTMVLFLALSLIFGPRLNILGVYAPQDQRALHRQHPPLQQVVADPRAPNFVILFSEAFRLDHFTPENAPFLWDLAQKNISFDNYYVVSAATRPSLTSFFTSLYPVQHGCYNLALSRAQAAEPGPQLTTTKVASSIVSFPLRLQQHGYRTVMVTSNGLAADPAFGFEDVFRRFDAADPYRFQVPALEAFIGFHFLKENLQRWRLFNVIVLSPEHSSTYFDGSRLNRTVLRELSKPDERPFCLYVHYVEPHSPYYRHPYPPVQINIYSPGRRDQVLDAYAAEIRAVDQRIAELCAELASRGLLENTYLFISTDHGEEFYDHGNWGHGKSLYPEIIKVPAVLVPPPALRRPVVVEEVVESIDIPPTITELAGVAAAEFWQGRSLVPLWTTAATDSLVDEGRSAGPGLAFGQFDDGLVFWASVVQGPWQVLCRGRDQDRKIMLFDLQRDPLAQRDLYGQDLAVEEELVSLLDHKLQDLQASAHMFQGEQEEIDPRLRQQLEALGYVE
jgi:arylsulfatase A-like enzyme